MKENKRGEKLVRQEMQTGILTRTDEYVKRKVRELKKEKQSQTFLEIQSSKII